MIKLIQSFLFFVIFMFAPLAGIANKGVEPKIVLIANDSTLLLSDSVKVQVLVAVLDTTIQIKNIKKAERQKKIVSALFAFPFPFGFVGAHRVMLGTKPWVPVVYVATMGGCFGILPLIDFCVIVFSKDVKQYENNPHIFMWIK